MRWLIRKLVGKIDESTAPASADRAIMDVMKGKRPRDKDIDAAAERRYGPNEGWELKKRIDELYGSISIRERIIQEAKENPERYEDDIVRSAKKELREQKEELAKAKFKFRQIDTD